MTLESSIIVPFVILFLVFSLVMVVVISDFTLFELYSTRNFINGVYVGSEVDGYTDKADIHELVDVVYKTYESVQHYSKRNIVSTLSIRVPNRLLFGFVEVIKSKWIHPKVKEAK